MMMTACPWVGRTWNSKKNMSSIMELSTVDSGCKDRDTGLVSRYGRTELSTKATGNETRLTAEASFGIQMAMCTMGTGSVTRLTERVSMST